ncbi:dTMP kinase [Tyzzerella sp. An114]|uniref:dTMP kinase n=1 Tax=Tyzzerella sp. An114 TaxID=1965545 RepID=UPI000B4317AC|nr:dTMP kinase [Tyzzerella sp. An114]OUQ58547.1 dTMP kinase [Tyzzerella sp. An114]
MKGLFITIEGTDGAGKSTQIELLTEYLSKKGRDVLVTREPGGTPIGEKIREIILDTENSEMSDITEAMLYAASRAQHVNEKIKPALLEGKIVICDRFVDSSIAYQSSARGISRELIEDINKYAVCGITPDITLYFDITPEEGIKRKKNMHKLDRIEKEKEDFHKRVYDGYQNLLKLYPERIKRVDASQSISDVHKQVIEYINKIL